MLFSLGMSNQCWMSAGRQLNSFVAVSASHFIVLSLSLDYHPWNAGSRSHLSTKNLLLLKLMFFISVIIYYFHIYCKKEKYSKTTGNIITFTLNIRREMRFLQIIHWLNMKQLNNIPNKTEQLSKRLKNC